MGKWVAVRGGPVVLLAFAAACRIGHAPSGRPGGTPSDAASDSATTAEVTAAVKLFYTRVSARDWDALKQSFWPRASVAYIMRPSPGAPDSVEVLPIEEVVVLQRGTRTCPVSFADEIVRSTITAYGPLADAWVTYRWRCGVTKDSVATHYGIDAVHLLKFRGAWRISGLAVTNELAGQPLEHTP